MKRATKSRKAETDPAVEFVKRLQEYYDFDKFDFNKFPESLPQKFPLKLGRKTVGAAFIDWKAVFVHLFATSVSTAKPAEVTHDEHDRRVTELWQAASPEVRNAARLPFFSMLFHMFEYLPTKVRDALVSLGAEAYHIGAVKQTWDRSHKITLSPIDTANSIAKRERTAILARLPKPPRESSKTKPAWRDHSTLKQYATLVGSRKLLVRAIKHVHDGNDGADGWTENLEESSDFQMLRTGIAKPVLNWGIKRVADQGLSKREREPLSIACGMVRRELGLDKQELQTLRNYYTKGMKLLKDDRAQHKTVLT